LVADGPGFDSRHLHLPLSAPCARFAQRRGRLVVRSGARPPHPRARGKPLDPGTATTLVRRVRPHAVIGRSGRRRRTAPATCSIAGMCSG